MNKRIIAHKIWIAHAHGNATLSMQVTQANLPVHVYNTSG